MSDIIGPIIRESKRIVKENGVIYIISSFKMDKYVISSKLIPFFEQNTISFTQMEDKNFLYIKITGKI